MSVALERLKRKALDLSPEDRAELAIKVWINTMQQEAIRATWEAEITARIAGMEMSALTPAYLDRAIARVKNNFDPANR